MKPYLSAGDVTQSPFTDLTGDVTVTNGPAAGLPSTLDFGQMYYATDTNQLYFGTPGIGLGHILIGDITGMNETLLQVLSELRCMRLALTKLACDGGGANPNDFRPSNLQTDPEIADQQQI